MEISCRDEYSGLKGIEPESTSLDRRRQTPKLRQRYNKIRGYLDWLRADFVKDAREKCSTECVFAESRSAKTLRDADGVLFHAKTHSERDFPPTKPPGAKYMLVSLEQERYAPLLASAPSVPAGAGSHLDGKQEQLAKCVHARISIRMRIWMFVRIVPLRRGPSGAELLHARSVPAPAGCSGRVGRSTSATLATLGPACTWSARATP